MFLAVPCGTRVRPFFSVRNPAAFRIGFLSTFGHFWRPKGSPKWHQNLTLSSLFPLLVLAPLFGAQLHEKVSFWRGPNHESVWPGQCLLNVRPFGRKTTFCRKNAPFWEPKGGQIAPGGTKNDVSKLSRKMTRPKIDFRPKTSQNGTPPC